jgi:hypothetical protein
MLASACMANAQTTAMSENSWEGSDNTYHRALLAPNDFDNMTMSFKDGKATFSGIPQFKRTVWAVVTNGEGEFIKQMKITQDENVMDLHRLHNGLYFVTIVYRSKSKKAFTLNL